MDSRIPAIALKHVTYFGGGALLAVATVLGAQTAVADITIWKHLGGTGEVVNQQPQAEDIELMNSVTAADTVLAGEEPIQDTVPTLITSSSDTSTESEVANTAPNTPVTKNVDIESADNSIHVSIDQEGQENDKETTGRVIVNGEEVATLPATTNINVDISNNETLDDSKNKTTVEIEQDTNTDTDTKTKNRVHIDQDIDVGNNDIRGEEQDIGNVTNGTVQIDLNGL